MTTKLVDFPDEVWRVLVTHVKNRHFTRLMLTGDALLQRRLRRTCGRHYDVSPDMSHFGVDASAVTVAGACSLALELRQWEQFLGHDSLPCATLTALTLDTGGADRYCNGAAFTHSDFSALVALRSLVIRGYAIRAQLTLPASICAVTVETMLLTQSDGMPAPPIHDVERLESLTALHLRTGILGFMVYPASSRWPPSLASLEINLGVDDAYESDISCLPPTLTSLRVRTSASSGPIDLYDLVSRRCPALVSLWVGGSAFVSQGMPAGLETLTVVNNILSAPHESLYEAFVRLPSTLRAFYLTDIRGAEIARALRLMLPRMQFENVDNVCRNVVRCCENDAQIDECLVEALTPWLENDRTNADNLVQWLRDRARQSLSHRVPQRCIDIEDLEDILDASASDSNGALVQQIARARFVWKRHPTRANGEYSFSACLRMLELGVTDWMCCSDDAPLPPLQLSPAVVCNLVELRICRQFFGVDTLRHLLAGGVLHALEHIEIGPSEDAFGDFISVLHAHRLHLPRLDLLLYVFSPIRRTRADVVIDDALLAMLADMRLYEKEITPRAVSFVYRVAPPPRQNATTVQ